MQTKVCQADRGTAVLVAWSQILNICNNIIAVLAFMQEALHACSISQALSNTIDTYRAACVHPILAII